jgi:predicted transposase/invertase (TIGR01784 family)
VTSTPHDALFKAVFSQPQHAAAELRALLPATLVARTDWSSLTLVPGSYVDASLRERQSDLLFAARVGDADARYYVLFEHQSEPDPRMAFRLLRYVVRIWERRLEEAPAELLPPVVPVVLSHSGRGWTVPTAMEALLDLRDGSDDLLPHVPRFSYLVDDLARASDEVLAKRIESLYVRLALTLLRDLRTQPILQVLARAQPLFSALERAETSAEAIGLLIRYILHHAVEDEHATILEVVGEIGPRTKDEAMRSIADKLMDEGFQKGLAKGLAEGRAEGLRMTLRKLIRLKLGELGSAQASRIDQADVATLERWTERVLTAASVDEILAP